MIDKYVESRTQLYKKSLLVERDLTFAKAGSLAQSVEIAVKGATELQTPTGNTTELHKVSCGVTACNENKSG